MFSSKMLTDSRVDIIAACSCHMSCVSSWSCVMCVLMIMCHVLFLLRGRALQWPASPPGQCLGVDNWVKIPPINVGVCHKSTQSKQCPGRVWPVPADQSPATVRADWPMVNRGLRVGCCHGAPTFLSRPSCGCPCLCPHMCRSGLKTSLKGAGPDQVCTSQPVTGATKWKSEAEIFYDKTLHWHWSLSVVCAGPWSLVM